MPESVLSRKGRLKGMIPPEWRGRFWLGLLLLLTAGCSAELSRPLRPTLPTGAISLYLQPLPQEAHRLTFSIDELVAVTLDGREIPLPSATDSLSGDDRIGRQQRLAQVALPPGRYLGIALRIARAELHGGEGTTDLLPPAEPLRIEHPFVVAENRADTLLLSLSGERLITDGIRFTPRFSLWQAERMLTAFKGFVSDGDAGTLTIFNKRTALVTDSVHIGKSPQDLVLDQRRGWLYVALAKEDAVAVLEINNGEILGRVRLRFGDEPTELALTASGDTLLALNRGSDSVSIIDTAALFERGRVRLTAPADELFVGGDESRVYVSQSRSSTLSILDPTASGRLLASRVLDQAPGRGAVSPDGQRIFLLSDYSPDLLVVNASSLATERKIHIGHGARDLLLDETSGLLYIAKEDGEIAVVDPRSLTAIDFFTLPGPVRRLSIDREENALFALLPQDSALIKINLVSKRELSRLDVGAGSRDLAVMGGR